MLAGGESWGLVVVKVVKRTKRAEQDFILTFILCLSACAGSVGLYASNTSGTGAAKTDFFLEKYFLGEAIIGTTVQSRKRSP